MFIVEKNADLLKDMQNYAAAHAKVFALDNSKRIKALVKKNKAHNLNTLKKNILHTLNDDYSITDFCFSTALGYVGKNVNVCLYKEFYYYVGALEDALANEITCLVPSKKVTSLIKKP